MWSIGSFGDIGHGRDYGQGHGFVHFNVSQQIELKVSRRGLGDAHWVMGMPRHVELVWVSCRVKTLKQRYQVFYATLWHFLGTSTVFLLRLLCELPKVALMTLSGFRLRHCVRHWTQSNGLLRGDSKYPAPLISTSAGVRKELHREVKILKGATFKLISIQHKSTHLHQNVECLAMNWFRCCLSLMMWNCLRRQILKICAAACSLPSRMVVKLPWSVAARSNCSHL